MDVIIKRATTDDAATIAALAGKTFYDTFNGTCTEDDIQGLIKDFFNIDAISKELADKHDHCYLASINNEPVGYMRFKENAKEFVSKWKAIELKRFYVLDEFHGKGIAQQMMNLFFEFVKNEGYQVVFLSVWEYNFRAQKFYEKYGFVNSGHTNFFPIGTTPQTDFWYWKFLE